MEEKDFESYLRTKLHHSCEEQRPESLCTTNKLLCMMAGPAAYNLDGLWPLNPIQEARKPTRLSFQGHQINRVQLTTLSNELCTIESSIA
tara:strand:+ start:62 stop:331 length:270 start_codon:yes stop_codon:yes gene_type:complete